jgi:hypothetical protein
MSLRRRLTLSCSPSAVNNGIGLQDPGACEANLGTNPDPHAVFMCFASQSMVLEPMGNLALSLPAIEAALNDLRGQLNAAGGPSSSAGRSFLTTAAAAAVAHADLPPPVPGNATVNHIAWYFPTRQIKTFHPRSVGMEAYRDAVIAAIKSSGWRDFFGSQPFGNETLA